MSRLPGSFALEVQASTVAGDSLPLPGRLNSSPRPERTCCLCRCACESGFPLIAGPPRGAVPAFTGANGVPSTLPGCARRLAIADNETVCRSLRHRRSALRAALAM